MHARPALVGNPESQFTARLRLAVESLRYGRGAAHFVEKQNLYFEIPAFRPDLEKVTDANHVCGFHWLLV